MTKTEIPPVGRRETSTCTTMRGHPFPQRRRDGREIRRASPPSCRETSRDASRGNVSRTPRSIRLEPCARTPRTHPAHTPHTPRSTPDVPGAVFVMDEATIAFADSARTLDRLITDFAEGRITQEQYREAVKAEIQAGRMLHTGNRSHEVWLTRKTLGCLLEFQIEGLEVWGLDGFSIATLRISRQGGSEVRNHLWNGIRSLH